MLTNLATLAQLKTALTTLYPSHSMSSPSKRKAESQDPALEYDWKEWRDYDKTAQEAVKDFHGVPSEVPEIKCTGDTEGKSMTVEVSGCAPGRYNQEITVFCTNCAVYMPSSGGDFPNPKKIQVKLNGEEGKKAAAEIKERLASAIATAENLQHFVSKGERSALKKSSPEERRQWVINKINSGWCLPLGKTMRVLMCDCNRRLLHPDFTERGD